MTTTTATTKLCWYAVAKRDELPEGRVRSVAAGERAICLTHWQGAIAALDNRCPHQGGPLGEGSIENGWLRCPWHGWDYQPTTGHSPGGYDDGVATFPVRVDDDGQIWVGVEEATSEARTASDAIGDVLEAWGVDAVFGMVGHSNLGLAEALRKKTEAGAMRFVGVRHEGAAAFAASAYGKLTGRPAACLTIAGPGATNLLTGLWDAKVDRAPVLALTGQVATQYLGQHNFQECDLAAAFAPVARFTQTVLNARSAPELTALALKHAIVHQDVAHLILPDEVQVLPEALGKDVAAASPGLAHGPAGRLPEHPVEPSPASIDALAERLAAAKRPLIIAGHGARAARADIIALAEHLDVPVVTTFKAKGLVPDDHPLAGGVLGRSGTPVASWFMNESDLLLVLGASFSRHTGITTHKPIVQVERDPIAIGRFHAVDLPVLGDIGRTLTRLRERLPEPHRRDSAAELARRWGLWRAEKKKRAKDDRGLGLPAALVFQELSRLVPADAVIAVDVGNNTYSFGRYFESRGQPVLMSGYLGSIGFALPAAIGAWTATRNKVVAVCGDGGLGQYLAEITTLVRHDMDVTLIVLVNDELGKISKEQRAGGWRVWQTSLVNPDFAAYARLCGANGVAVATRAELQPALAGAIAHTGPSVVAIRQDALLV